MNIEQNYKMIFSVHSQAVKQKVSTYKTVEDYLVSLSMEELEELIKAHFPMSKGIHKRPKDTYKERIAKSIVKIICQGDCFLYY